MIETYLLLQNNFKVTRGNFHSLDEHHVEHFAGIVGETNLIMDLSDLEQYNVDWMKHLRGITTVLFGLPILYSLFCKF